MYQQLSLNEMQRENRTREERYDQFKRIITQNGKTGITHLQICKIAGLKKSPYTRSILIDLFNDGVVVVDRAIAANSKEVIVFFPYNPEIQSQRGKDNG